MIDLVGAGQMRGGVVGDARPDRIPCAAIDREIIAQRQESAIVVKADFNIVQLIARVRRA